MALAISKHPKLNLLKWSKLYGKSEDRLEREISEVFFQRHFSDASTVTSNEDVLATSHQENR